MWARRWTFAEWRWKSQIVPSCVHNCTNFGQITRSLNLHKLKFFIAIFTNCQIVECPAIIYQSVFLFESMKSFQKLLYGEVTFECKSINLPSICTSSPMNWHARQSSALNLRRMNWIIFSNIIYFDITFRAVKVNVNYMVYWVRAIQVDNSFKI